MMTRVVRRAVIAAVVLGIVVAGIAHADALVADGDSVTPSAQTMIDLGTVDGGAVVNRNVGFVLECRGTGHVERGSTMRITPVTLVAPTGGAITATTAAIGPIPDDWPLSGEPCLNDEMVAESSLSEVRITAPTAGGVYTARVNYGRSPSSGLTNTTSISFRVTVRANQPPAVTVPADVTAEGDSLGGWTAAWEATASDPEDGALTPTCTPAEGTVLAVGTARVTCTATDSAGLSSSGSFEVTVTDTTAPAIAGPADMTVGATSASGAVVSWPQPTAIDIVDGSVGVGCTPTSGVTFPVGSTTVSCSASDRAGNQAQAPFTVTVTRQVVLDVAWREPVGTSQVLVANPGRIVPVKASLTLDGSPLQPGAHVPRLVLHRLEGCNGPSVERRDGGALDWEASGWRRNLDTSPLGRSCWRVSVSVDGVVGGAFVLDLRSDPAEPAKKSSVPTP